MFEEKIEVTQYTCQKCKHKWIPRMGKKPKVCPECKRDDWDKPKKVGAPKIRDVK